MSNVHPAAAAVAQYAREARDALNGRTQHISVCTALNALTDASAFTATVYKKLGAELAQATDDPALPAHVRQYSSELAGLAREAMHAQAHAGRCVRAFYDHYHHAIGDQRFNSQQRLNDRE